MILSVRLAPYPTFQSLKRIQKYYRSLNIHTKHFNILPTDFGIRLLASGVPLKEINSKGKNAIGYHE